MNETICLLNSHRSDRSFTSEAISDEALETILEAARRAPSSSNGQHISLVVVRDAARRARIAEIAGGQPWIAKAPVFITVVADFYKTSVGAQMVGEVQDAHETVEAFIVAMTDAGITLATLMTAARSLGLGIVPIGGIRRHSQELVDLLQLPHLAFPVVGVAIGHVEKPATQKPRLPMKTYRHDETYHTEGLKEAIVAYDETLMKYWKSIGRSDGKPWSVNTAEYQKLMRFRDVKQTVAKQGLTHDK